MRFFKEIFSKLEIIRELLYFLAKNKKYWLLPIIVVLATFAILIILAETSPLAPFIYTLF